MTREEYLNIKGQIARQVAEIAILQATVDSVTKDVNEVAEGFEAEIAAELEEQKLKEQLIESEEIAPKKAKAKTATKAEEV